MLIINNDSRQLSKCGKECMLTVLANSFTASQLEKGARAASVSVIRGGGAKQGGVPGGSCGASVNVADAHPHPDKGLRNGEMAKWALSHLGISFPSPPTA